MPLVSVIFCIEKAVLPFGKTAEGGEKIHIVGQNFYKSKFQNSDLSVSLSWQGTRSPF